MDPELKRSLKTLVKWSIFAVGLLVFYLLVTFLLPLLGGWLRALPGILAPFIVAVLFAVAVEPLVDWFERRLKTGRTLAVLLTLLLVVGLSGFLLTALVARLVRELSGLYGVLVEQAPQISDQVMDWLGRAQVFYLQLRLPENVQESIRSGLLGLLGGVQEGLAGTANAMVALLGALPGFVVFLLIATVATFFITRDRAAIRRWFLGVLPASWRGTVRVVINDLFAAFTGFLKAYSLLVTVTAVLTVIGLKVLGVKYALSLGMLTGLLDLLPVLGPGLMFLSWAAFSFATGKTGFAVGLLVVYGVISAVRQVLEPKVVGDQIGLPPLATLFSLYVGLKLLGPSGLILGPVTVILLMACQRAGVFARLAQYYRRV
ncbi:MAG: sporulation integral membrane protein YtvI [Syntrophomonadaceae bacterium]|nr:sporulation integral membrane protein YtvI [Syntrophomonadaceae bacterium]